MPIDPRFKVTGGSGLKRDVRPMSVRTIIWLKKPGNFLLVMFVLAFHFVLPTPAEHKIGPGQPDMSFFWAFTDLVLWGAYRYYKWFKSQLLELPLKLPSHAAPLKDKNNPNPANGKPGKAEGILFLGNIKDGIDKNNEVWITNSDARTHILFLGTTGAGKSEGLKSICTNSLCWGSGFVYVDGKAQNTLWGDVYSLARRFGRDDDVLVLNYMTGNSDNSSRSNSLNPFSIGSASYLTQMMVGLMDDSGDDGMWKGRAIALMSAVMPALTWKRDNQGLLLDVGVIRDNLTMQQIIKMSRDPAMPDRIIRGLQSYLETLPGYVDSCFDDEGNERPPSQDQPMVDLSQTRQQHGYLTMQFTRSLSSLGDEYGYIFKQQMADIDMMDVVLNRRILVVLIPALEKSPDEAANLGKIVVAAIKGMMGATLGSELEGEQTSFIDNNPTTSASPFITIFDEVGYYTSPGMGVMAAQARSLGFCLIFAGQDMPALQKRVKEEALSITGNCNLKIFGKLEDPTETKDFFEKTVGSALVSEVSGFSSAQGLGRKSYFEGDNITFQARKEASYDDLKRQNAGQVHILWAEKTIAANMFYANVKRVNVVRVQRLIGVSGRNWSVEARDKAISEVLSHLRDRNWKAANGAPVAEVPEINILLEGLKKAKEQKTSAMEAGTWAAASVLLQQKRRAGEAVAVPHLGVDSAAWPLPPAGAPAQPMAAGAASPPWMGGSPAQPAAAATQAPPPWMGGAPAQPAAAATQAPPPWMGGAPAQPAAAATQAPPPWMGGAPAQPAAAATQAPPPWMGGAPAQPAAAATQAPPPWAGNPVTPPRMPPAGASPLYQQPQQPPLAAPPAGQGAGQPLAWGNVMGAASGMGTPPAGAQMVPSAPPPAPPPAWMAAPVAPVQQAPAFMAPPVPAPQTLSQPPVINAAAVPPWVAQTAQPPMATPQPLPPMDTASQEDTEMDHILKNAAADLAQEMFKDSDSEAQKPTNENDDTSKA